MTSKTISFIILGLSLLLLIFGGCFKVEKSYGIPDDYISGSWYLKKVVIDGDDSTAHAFKSTSPDCQYSFSINRREEKLSIYGTCLVGVFTLDKKNKKLRTCMVLTNCCNMLKSARYPFLDADYNWVEWTIVSITQKNATLKTVYDNKMFEISFDIIY